MPAKQQNTIEKPQLQLVCCLNKPIISFFAKSVKLILHAEKSQKTIDFPSGFSPSTLKSDETHLSNRCPFPYIGSIKSRDYFDYKSQIIPSFRGTLPVHAIQSLRTKRTETPCHIAGPLAQLRKCGQFHKRTDNCSPGVRPWNYPFRSREQLWSATRVGGGEFWQNPQTGFCLVSR